MSTNLVPRRARILFADDHTLIAEACKRLLEPEFEVVGIVKDGRALVRAYAELKPDVVIADVSMPLLNGIDAAEQIRESSPKARVIFLTMNTDRELAARAFRGGAMGYVLKISAAAELVKAVRAALAGSQYISPLLTRADVTHFLGRHHASAEENSLTARQREVLQLLAEGLSMKEVAAVLNVATRTVAFHKYRIMDVLSLKTNADLVQYAIRAGLIRPGN
jgi:DNA-binding NarL/FixJ family response regulator